MSELADQYRKRAQLNKQAALNSLLQRCRESPDPAVREMVHQHDTWFAAESLMTDVLRDLQEKD